MLKKDTFQKVSLGVHCGDCIHFNGPAKFEKACSMLGVDSRSRAPDCFNPDVFKLKDTSNPELLKELGNLIRNFKPHQLRIMAFMLARQGNAMSKAKLKFGQPVYFSLGGDYLSHYFKGYVVSASDDSVYVVAKLNKCKTNTSLTLDRTSVLTRTEYKELESTLVDENRIFMSPAEKRKCRVLPIAEQLDEKGRVPHVEQFKDDYEPPSIDTAPPEWLNVYAAANEEKRKKKKKPKGVFLTDSKKHKARVIESQANKILKEAYSKEKKKKSSKTEKVW